MHLKETVDLATRDHWIFWISIFLRMMSYGITNQVLTLYLKSLSISETEIGLFMTLTLIGDTFISYWLTWYCDIIGRRNVMIIGAISMTCSGAIFALNSNFVILLMAAIIGIISPSGEESGPFKSVEEASIAHITPIQHRTEVFAIYGMLGTFGSAIGSIICGFIVQFLEHNWQWEISKCYKFTFWLYSILASTKLLLFVFLTDNCEVTQRQDQDEEEILLSENEQDDIGKAWSGLSFSTHKILIKLLAIFMIDSGGYGFMTSAWVVYYFKTVFQITASALGTLFFITNLSISISSIPSGFFAKRYGPIKATLLTQTPSGLFFILIPILNFQFYLAATSLIIYSILMTMDVVPRQILLTTLIPNEELTKSMGIVNVGKTLARCIGPIFTGKLSEMGLLWVCYVIGGISVFISGGLLAYYFKYIDDIFLQQQE